MRGGVVSPTGRWVLRGFVFLALVAFGGDHTAAAARKLTFGADVRLRYEFQDNFNQQYYGEHPGKGSERDGFVLGRFRAGLDYRPGDHIHLALWMQDAEAWDMALRGSDFYNSKFGMEQNPNKDRWELWDTFLEVRRLGGLPLDLKGGRQRLFYGNKRVFGPGAWGNSGRWIWDAVKLSCGFENGFVDTFYGRTMLHDPNENSLNHRHGFESAGVYSRFVMPDKLLNIVFEPFCMTKTDDHDRYQGENGRPGDLDTYYYGLRICGRNIKGGFDYDATYIAQQGDFSNDTVDAYGYHLMLAYNFKYILLTPRISIEYSFGSGDEDPTDGTLETFDGAFGARDKMYGRMNLFYWKNLEDAQVNLELKPFDWLGLTIGYHKFRLAEKKDAWYLNAKAYRDKTGASGDEVGRELDIVGAIELPGQSWLDVGFGHFRPDEFARNQASDKPANWLFLQYCYRFSGAII